MMKKYFHNMLMAALIGSFSWFVTACSDDDDKGAEEAASSVSVEQGLLTHGIEANVEACTVDVNVTAKGQWTATVTKGTNWVCVDKWQVSYNGSQKLTLRFDNNPTGYDRTTTLNLGNSDGEFQTITVRQKGSQENGSGESFAGRGVGCGIDYTYAFDVKVNSKQESIEQFNPRKVMGNNNLFNITQIQKLQQNGLDGEKLQASAYVEAPINFADLKAALFDSSLVQSKTVDLSLELGVSFGVIEFSAHGAYKSTKDEKRTYVDYSVVRNAPMYNVYLSPAELSAYSTHHRNIDEKFEDKQYDQIDQIIASYVKANKRKRLKNLDEDGLTPEQREEIDNLYDNIKTNWDFAGIFSVNFTDLYNDLYNAISKKNKNKKPIDEEAANAALNSLDNLYGPFFISGGEFGGALVVTMQVNNRYMEGSDTFEGDLEADVAGMFNVSGSFKYSSSGFDVMHNSKPTFYIYGGNAIDTANELYRFCNGTEPDDKDALSTILENWVYSMYTAGEDKLDQSKAEPMSFRITPIWTLFNETDIQQYAQEYFMKKYESRGIKEYFGVANGEPNPGAEKLIRNLANAQ